MYALYYAKTNRGNYPNEDNIKDIVIYIREGILDNGILREFNILDYYLIFSIPLTKLKELSIKLPQKERNLIYEFINKHYLKMIPKYSIIDTQYEINCQKDKNGLPIKGTGIIITNEEKELIINYLIANDIPISEEIYKVALKRYIEGPLIIKQDEILTLK